MAKGTLKVFDALIGYIEDQDIQWSDSFALALLSNPITSLLVTETNPALGSTNCTEVAAGGNYTAGGVDLTLDNSLSGGVRTVKLNTTTHPSGLITISQDPAGPTNVKTALFYDKDATTPVDAAVAYIDLTENGGITAINNGGQDIEITFDGGGTPGVILTVGTSNP